MSEYAAQWGRSPWIDGGKLVVRRVGMRHNASTLKVGDEIPTGDLNTRQIAVLWEQGWIDTLPRDQVLPPAKTEPRAQQRSK